MQYFAKMYSDIPVMDLARNRLTDYPLKDQISALLLFYRSEEMFNRLKLALKNSIFVYPQLGDEHKVVGSMNEEGLVWTRPTD